MSVEEFTKLCQRHDWHYDRSDNWGVFSNGQRERMAMESLAARSPQLKKIYDDYRSKRL